jgi:ATP-dependent phosphofructokinase / diphosphate-dependent phosphofructokinase
MVGGVEGILADRLIPLSKMGDSERARLAATPGAALGSCRRQLTPGDLNRLFEVLDTHRVRYLIYAGGGGAMETCAVIDQEARFRDYDLQVMGVPKTIENDLAGTDHCPGFGSAARFVAQTTQESGLDLMTSGGAARVVVTEVMGKRAGWLAASAALGRMRLADPPHLLVMPERPVDETVLLDAVDDCLRRLGVCSITVSEGARGPDGAPLAVPAGGADPRAGVPCKGSGAYVAALIGARLGLSTHLNRPGTIQRVSSAHRSCVDNAEAWAVGESAARQLLAGEESAMVTLVRVADYPYRWRTGLAPLEGVAKAERLLPDQFIAAGGFDVTSEFCAYARPLIGAPLPDPLRF